MPSTDPRFLDADLEEMLTDVWAHRFADDPKLLEQIEDDDFDLDAVLDDVGRFKDHDGVADDWEDL